MLPRGTGRRARACAALALPLALASAASAQAQLGDRTLKIGSRGRDVKTAQKELTAIGLTTKADGVYGRGTALNVKRFEREEGRHVDGALNPADAAALETAAADAAAGGADPSTGQAADGTGGYSYDPNNTTGKARLSADGRTAVAPDNAPQQVKDAVAAANQITSKPYKYGGGHASWNDTGYDCSGTVSYALHGAGLLDKPIDSSQLESFATAGKGQWITVYANSGHTFVVIAGLRLDTSGAGEDGPRWRTDSRSTAGYVVRHPDGL
jgi:peptidoglycan hydrolase-like protein with peptidoglycan-binding domain